MVAGNRHVVRYLCHYYSQPGGYNHLYCNGNKQLRLQQ
jgi:hypothetical protein